MVLGYHLILGTYGFWLPNDPRGSWSEMVRAWELLRFGPAIKTTERRSLARKPHDHARRLAAKEALRYPAVRFNGVQARAVGRGFGAFAVGSGLTIWACSILPDHIHLAVARHRYPVEQLCNLLRGAATRQLVREGVHPSAAFGLRNGRFPKAFARGEWKVFLNTAESIRRSIRYVENNPIKERKPPQRWSFVVPFRGIEEPTLP
jgi:REP element-mobilizing transposase RayT